MKGGSKNSTWKNEPKTRPTLSYEWDTKRGKAKTRPHRQHRLGAVKRLDLRLFIHTRHQRPLWRVQIKPDDVGQFAVKLGVGAELKALHPARLQPVFAPDAMHAGPPLIRN